MNEGKFQLSEDWDLDSVELGVFDEYGSFIESLEFNSNEQPLSS